MLHKLEITVLVTATATLLFESSLMINEAGRKRSSSKLRTTAVLLLLLLPYLVVETVASDAAKENRTAYDWENLNHYEILELSEYLNKKTREAAEAPHKARLDPSLLADKSEIAKADIRKAYIKQALLHHPDKLMAINTEDGGKTKEQLLQEGTQRMQRITEAYGTLSDEHKRQIYDRVLLYVEENERRSDLYAAQMNVKRCKSDNECVMEEGECCIKYHFWFCGDLDKYPAKGLRCSGIVK